MQNHPNATVYRMLQGLVDMDGYYLESAPCLVCNNPELPFTVKQALYMDTFGHRRKGLAFFLDLHGV